MPRFFSLSVLLLALLPGAAPSFAWGGSSASSAGPQDDFDIRYTNALTCRAASHRYQPFDPKVSEDPTQATPLFPLVVRGDQGTFAQDYVFEQKHAYLFRFTSKSCQELRDHLRSPGQRLIQLYQVSLKDRCPKVGLKNRSGGELCTIALKDRIKRIQYALDPKSRCDADMFKQILLGLPLLPDGKNYLRDFEVRDRFVIQQLEKEARRAFDRPWEQPDAPRQADLPPHPFVDSRSYDAQLRSSPAFHVTDSRKAYPTALLAYRSTLEQCTPTFPLLKSRIGQLDRMFGTPPRNYRPSDIGPAQGPLGSPSDSGRDADAGTSPGADAGSNSESAGGVGSGRAN